ncbi:MAG: Flp pilus assembly complex ATPase component TadA, partial [Deltaproteobacteria bacterium]|nr:Flp pilus assembly complex ATPase component TadA [Deltaproteobacteria bacterium]
MPSASYKSEPPHVQGNRTRLGLLLVDEGFISPNQLQEALRLQKEHTGQEDDHRYLGQILVDKKYIDADQLRYIMEKHNKKTRIGDILVRNRAISEQELEFALIEQRKSGKRLGEILLKKNLVSEETMRQALCTQLNIPYLDLSRVTIDRNLTKIINRDYAWRHKIVPVAMTEGSITLAMDDPTDNEVVAELEMFTRLKINVVTSSRKNIDEAFRSLYPSNEALRRSAKTTTSGQHQGPIDSDFKIDLESDDTHSVRKPQYVEAQESKRADVLVQKILSLAIQRQASDIHLETLGQRMVVRFRIDGLLQEFDLGSFQDDIDNFHREIISRIKILAKLDIAEKRLAQDGSFRSHMVKEGQRINIDFRISVIPSYYGENIVVRILDSRRTPSTIEKIGFSPRLTARLIELFNKNTGIILVTGPTGSGKSTTLQSGLLSAYRPGLKVVTAEDPIEYVHDNFMQCEVNEKIGLTFASYIRVFLRHDPEIIMIGEIRDDETAKMAVRAAQTGHLVLSTLHTNDSLGTINRLVGLGIDPNMVSSSLLGVVSQRLSRRICPDCKTEYTPPEEMIAELFLEKPDRKWVKGQGCANCNYTGYKGRLPLAELWVPSQHDVLLINKQAPLEDLRESARAGTISLISEALLKLEAGETTIEELLRVLPYSIIEDYRQQQRLA